MVDKWNHPEDNWYVESFQCLRGADPAKTSVRPAKVSVKVSFDALMIPPQFALREFARLLIDSL